MDEWYATRRGRIYPVSPLLIRVYISTDQSACSVGAALGLLGVICLFPCSLPCSFLKGEKLRMEKQVRRAVWEKTAKQLPHCLLCIVPWQWEIWPFVQQADVPEAACRVVGLLNCELLLVHTLYQVRGWLCYLPHSEFLSSQTNIIYGQKLISHYCSLSQIYSWRSDVVGNFKFTPQLSSWGLNSLILSLQIILAKAGSQGLQTKPSLFWSSTLCRGWGTERDVCGSCRVSTKLIQPLSPRDLHPSLLLLLALSLFLFPALVRGDVTHFLVLKLQWFWNLFRQHGKRGDDSCCACLPCGLL